MRGECKGYKEVGWEKAMPLFRPAVPPSNPWGRSPRMGKQSVTIDQVIRDGRAGRLPHGCIRYGAHVANREFALLFGAAFCDDFEEFSDIQVLWADMFALSAFDTLVRCCRLCGEP